MKVTKSQLKQIIKEELSAMMEISGYEQFKKNQADARKYRKKGKWILKKTGASEYVKPGGSDESPVWGTREEARVFKDELTAEVHKKAIEEKGLAVTIENMSEAGLEEDKKKTKVTNPGQKRVSKKIGHLVGKEEKSQEQAAAIAYSMENRGELKKGGKHSVE